MFLLIEGTGDLGLNVRSARVYDSYEEAEKAAEFVLLEGNDSDRVVFVKDLSRVENGTLKFTFVPATVKVDYSAD